MKDVIIDAAKTVFLREGYNASIESIIREAGIARQSLYNHFKSKKVLFQAVIEHATWQTMKPLLSLELEPDTELPEALHQFAQSYMAGTLHPDSLALTRLVGSAAAEVPNIGSIAYEAGPQRSIPMLAAYLRGQADAGKIVCSSPEAIAESFFGALVGPARFRYLFGVPINNSPAQRRAYVGEIVNLYVNGLRYQRADTSAAARRDGKRARGTQPSAVQK